MNFIYISFHFQTEIHKDPLKFMEKANQRGERLAVLFIDFYIFVVEVGFVILYIIIATFSKMKYGYINYDVLFYPFKLE